LVLDGAPNVCGDFDAAFEFAPLLVFGEEVAFLGAGEAALRAEGELFEGEEFRCGVDAALESYSMK
jgi:hypothetical protein